MSVSQEFLPSQKAPHRLGARQHRDHCQAVGGTRRWHLDGSLVTCVVSVSLHSRQFTPANAAVALDVLPRLVTKPKQKQSPSRHIQRGLFCQISKQEYLPLESFPAGCGSSWLQSHGPTSAGSFASSLQTLLPLCDRSRPHRLVRSRHRTHGSIPRPCDWTPV